MRHVKRLLWSLAGLLLLAALSLPLGCSSSPDGDASGSGGAAIGSGGSSAGSGGSSGSGGASGSGGVTGSGGSGSGGKLGSGGTMAGSGGAGTGGTTGASGGVTGSGGKASSGGAGGGTGAAGGQTGSAGNGGGPTSSGGAAGGRSGAGGIAGGKVRVMPLGDSTTASICYRSHLWQLLTQAGHTQFDFIGTRNGDPGCSFTGYDKDNEGHGGYIVTDLLKATSTGRPSGADTSDPYDSSAKDLATWFDGHPADIALMHFGTNDVWNGKDPADILKAYSAILARLRANNPNVRLMIAQLTPMNPSGCGDKCTSGVPALNAMIPAWATQNSTTQSPVTVVDQYTNFNADTDTKDGVHSNDMGALKIATNWFNALGPLL